MKNSDRMIVRMIREICQDEGIQCTAFSYGWVLKLQKGSQVGYVFGYDFGVNNAASARICDDKCATSDILSHFGIPAVEHLLFLSPNNAHYIGAAGNWEKASELLEKHGELVCKANEGSGGAVVYHVSSQVELESVVHEIFQQKRTMAICPYYRVLTEYRAIVLNNAVKLVYAKNIPCIIGDGKKSIRELLLDYMSARQMLIRMEYNDDVLNRVLPQGEKHNVNWKSNLGQGAVPTIVEDKSLLAELSELSLRAANAISIDFASVDIIDTNEGLMVLEVNCGIMMEKFILFGKGNYGIAKGIYREAVHGLMSGEGQRGI